MIEYFINNWQQIGELFLIHVQLTINVVGIAIVLGVPLGILITYFRPLKLPILGATNLIQAIPSMALLGFMIPILGIGERPAILVVVLYSLLPIVKNTYIGMSNIEPEMIEAATGIGLKSHQILARITFPIALPFIMAGIRISAVTAVGILTIAAFVGADGLGFLIFSGIRSLNTNQILAGAIPAVCLALAVDFILGVFEFAITPIGLKMTELVDKQKLKFKVKLARMSIGVLLLGVGGAYVYSYLQPSIQAEKVFVIGSKDFTEQLILGHIFEQFIEAKTDIEVEQKANLGGTQVVFDALQRGDIGMYIEYTGTIYVDILKHAPISDVAEVYTTSKAELEAQFNVHMLEQMHFNNTFTLAVKSTLAEEYGLQTMSDLKAHSQNLVTGTSFEFLNREDGLVGIQKVYGLKFKDSLGLDSSTRYLALENDDVQIIDAFSTDGLLKKFDLVVLEDDLGVFPPFYAVPVVNDATMAAYPELQAVIDLITNELTNETMIELNYLVDVQQVEAATVAHQFLVETQLITD